MVLYCELYFWHEKCCWKKTGINDSEEAIGDVKPQKRNKKQDLKINIYIYTIPSNLQVVFFMEPFQVTYYVLKNFYSFSFLEGGGLMEKEQNGTIWIKLAK